jgi:hypothetical protein
VWWLARGAELGSEHAGGDERRDRAADARANTSVILSVERGARRELAPASHSNHRTLHVDL